MKHTARTILAALVSMALHAMLSLGAITTTLEYEDARETNTLAVLRAEIAAAQPADYANVSNRAVNAVLTNELSSLEIDPVFTNFLAHGGTVSGSFAQGSTNNTASGVSAHAEGHATVASGSHSHAEGHATVASGYGAHAEGESTVASNYFSHAEGYGTVASNSFSHAEGYGTTASGYASHAEGYGTTASGYFSHAEGDSTTASGNASHAEGGGAQATNHCAYVYSGVFADKYGSHGDGTFNINPVGGTDGMWIGETNLTQHIAAATSALEAAYKPKQSAVASPSAATTEAYQFIDTVSQDTNGVITATKKTMRKATTSAPGMVQLNDNIDSTRTDHAATANALRIVAENADAAMDAANAAGVAATAADAKATAVATASTNYTDSVAAPIWSYVLGDTVWFAVTNYMRTISGVAPALQLWEVRDGATNLIYSSTEEITNLINKAVAPLATTQALHEVQAALPSKAWSRYQSATGADNPEPATVTIVSTPVVQLTGGGEWQPHTLAAGGMVWTLESNGLTSIGGTTNGYLVVRNTITGEEVFSVEERSFIPSVPVVDSFTPKSGGNGFVFTVYADARPTLYTATNLTDRVKVAWDAEGDDPNVIVNSWTNNGDGTWTVDVSLVVPSASYYAYVGVSESTESIISNKRAVSFDGGVYVDGAKWRLGTATISGVKVLTVEAMP